MPLRAWTLITVTFHQQGDRTEVIMEHALLPNEEARQAHRDGWTSCLDRLEKKFT